MDCTNCGYLLFNLQKPVCPECGLGFDLARYRFEMGAVSFHCPCCSQEYYGNDAQGLPFPRDFRCLKCNEPISLQEMMVVPQRDDARGELVSVSPWDNRARLGFWRAWWQTFTMTLLKPSEFFRAHFGQSNRDAWLFSMTAMYVGLVPYMLIQFALLSAVGSFASMAASRGGAAPPPFPLAVFAGMYLFVGLVVPSFAPFVIAGFWACVIQPALFLLAPQRKSMGHTFRTVMYSLGPTAIYLIPFCGGSIGGVWHFVALTNGIKEVHRISGLRASIAVLWPVVAMLGTFFVFFVWFAYRGVR